MHRRGFTLVEILTVIAILGIVLAILLPVFATVRRKSYESSCLSNLKQLGAATLLYAQDYDDHFPFGGDNIDRFGWIGSDWEEDAKSLKLMPDLLLPYTKTREVWHCPADTGFTITGITLDIELDGRPNSFQRFGMSYHVLTIIPLMRETVSGIVAHNSYVGTDQTPFGPSQIPLLFDASGEWHAGMGLSEDRYRYNILFCDGHAASTSRAQFASMCAIHIGP